ncbi:hypothetical protein GCM10009080_17340 [Cupriavidus pauculus]
MKCTGPAALEWGLDIQQHNLRTPPFPSEKGSVPERIQRAFGAVDRHKYLDHIEPFPVPPANAIARRLSMTGC